jgi:hypothetical protein
MRPRLRRWGLGIGRRDEHRDQREGALSTLGFALAQTAAAAPLRVPLQKTIGGVAMRASMQIRPP